MATVYNTSIVRDGLVFYIDAANPKSYPARNIVSAKIYSTYNGLRSANYTVQYSDDNITWVTAFSGVMSNNASYGLQVGSGSGSGTYNCRRYWRYVEGSAVVSHHPRTSRIVLTDTSGNDYNIIVYTTDNTSDVGQYIIGTVTYDFGSTTWTDLSTSGLNMTMQGTVTWNSGGYFTGWSTANYFSNAGAISTYLPQGDAPRTIIALVEQGTVSGYQHAVHYGPGGVLNETYGIATSGGVLSDHRWGSSNIGGATTIAGQKYVLSTRHSTLYPGSRHFVNGTFTDIATITTAATAATTFRIGLRVNAVAESWAADGKIYAVMIYNRALTDAEILQNYNALRGRVAL